MLETASSRIRILPPELIARIAAGEVIERPASVLKELVENALDAGASRIRADIAGGGVEQIAVNDDGIGMSPADLLLSVQPHATSKLQDADELHNLSTLGFRGEALPSIASVSRLSIVTRQRSFEGSEASDSGWRVDLMPGDSSVQPRPAAAAFGTRIEARDLFFNLPVRKKFLKGLASEAASCADTFQRLALTRPDVSFFLYQNGQALLELPAVCPRAPEGSKSFAGTPSLPAGAWHQRARDVLGRANSGGLLELDIRDEAAEGQNHRLLGLLSPPAVTRPNRNLIFLSVNGRAVKDRTLTSALLEACRHLLPPRRYPVAVLFLELPGAEVDINVHPAKAEVRFRQSGRIYALLHHAVRSACLDHPAPARSDTPLPRPSAPRLPLSFAPTGPLLRESLNGAGAGEGIGRKGESPEAKGADPEVFDVIAAQAEPGDRTVNLWPHSKNSSPVPAPEEIVAQESPAPYAQPLSAADRLPPSRPLSLAARETSQKGSHDAMSRAAPLDFRVIGQSAGSYIVLEDETGLRIIDQHALHERILFERLLAAGLTRARGDSQGLLVPESIELSAAQAALCATGSHSKSNGSVPPPLELLSEMGFECESFGPRALLIRAVPAILKNASAGKLVSEFLDALSGDDPPASVQSRSARRFSLREKCAYILSCKAALKAGERLTVSQMEALILEFRAVAGPLAERGNLTCPHGRKLSLDLSWHELERAVGRA